MIAVFSPACVCVFRLNFRDRFPRRVTRGPHVEWVRTNKVLPWSDRSRPCESEDRDRDHSDSFVSLCEFRGSAEGDQEATGSEEIRDGFVFYATTSWISDQWIYVRGRLDKDHARSQRNSKAWLCLWTMHSGVKAL